MNRAVRRKRHATSSPSATRTRPGRPTRCASSSATSPTTTSPTSAGKLRLERPDGRTERASTGGTRCGCARASPRSARSPAATARSTPSGETDYVESALRPRPRLPRADGATRAGARSTSTRRSPSRSRARTTRTSSAARCGCCRGRGGTSSRREAQRPAAALPRGAPLARVLRYASGFLHVALLATSIALVGQGWPIWPLSRLRLAWLALAALGRLRVPIPGAGIAYYYFL